VLGAIVARRPLGARPGPPVVAPVSALVLALILALIRRAGRALAGPTVRALTFALIPALVRALISTLIRTLSLAGVRAPLGAGVRPALAGLAGIVIAFAHAGLLPCGARNGNFARWVAGRGGARHIVPG
jgi:hypothetical protein